MLFSILTVELRDIDETDREILRLLVRDARQPYSDIAEAVGLSAPAVRDRIDRLQDLAVIERFTVDIDRSKFREGAPLLLDLTISPAGLEEVKQALAGTDGVEHLFTTADSRIVCQGIFPSTIQDFLADSINLDLLQSYQVHLLSSVEWRPDVPDVSLALECAECGNTVTSEGESVMLDGEQYHFCCQSCQSQFEDRYAELEDGI